MRNWPQLARTIRFLRPSQLAWRLRYWFGRRYEESRFVRSLRRKRSQQKLTPGRYAAEEIPSIPLFEEPGDPEKLLTDLEAGYLCLLHTRLPFRGGPDWRMTGGRQEHRLWTYTLHYHEWIFDLVRAFVQTRDRRYGACAGRFLQDWMAVCRLDEPGFTHYPWNSYATATRLGWWCRMLLLAPASFWGDLGPAQDEILASLAQQADYLHRHLEWDLRGNHLLRDAVGLAWAGRLLREDRRNKWLTTATRLAVEQAAEQVLPDGGHFERSPLYHLDVMEDLLVLALLLEDPQAQQQLRKTWAQMAEFLAWVRHPDGDLPLFNDGSLAGAEHVEQLLKLGSTLGVSVAKEARRGGRHFPDTGLAIWQGEPWTVFFDIGRVGPDYQPGHAHADTLAIECSFSGQRLFVDAGTFAYDHDDRRRYDRSTAAHNTVCIDGQDSSEVWHIFRVGRRAYLREVQVDFTADGMKAAAAHTGYAHLPGRPRHHRQISVADHGNLVLTDRVDGQGHHRVQGGFLLAPQWTATRASEGWLLQKDQAAVRLIVKGTPDLVWNEERRPYHPDYGLELESTYLAWHREGPLPVEVTIVVEGV